MTKDEDTFRTLESDEEVPLVVEGGQVLTAEVLERMWESMPARVLGRPLPARALGLGLNVPRWYKQQAIRGKWKQMRRLGGKVVRNV